MSPSSIPTRDASCVQEELEGETVLYGVASLQACYLNESASLVWRLIDGERNVASIKSLLLEAYPEIASISDDVEATLQTLVAYGAVRLK